MMDEVRNQVRGDGGQYTDTQAAGHAAGFVGHQLFDALGLVQGYLCLTDNLFADGGGGDVLPVAVEYFYIEFLFQFLNHGAQGRLGNSACLGCQYKVAVLVQCHDIFHLLQIHTLIDFIYTKIGKICCIA